MLRESAPQLALVGLVVLAILLLIGAAGKTIGVIGILIVALAALAEIRQGWLAHRSTARIDQALDGIEAAADDAPRIPRSHLVIPPLAFVTRGVNRTRGVKFAEFDGVSLRLDIYRPADDHLTITTFSRP